MRAGVARGACNTHACLAASREASLALAMLGLCWGEGVWQDCGCLNY